MKCVILDLKDQLEGKSYAMIVIQIRKMLVNRK